MGKAGKDERLKEIKGNSGDMILNYSWKKLKLTK